MSMIRATPSVSGGLMVVVIILSMWTAYDGRGGSPSAGGRIDLSAAAAPLDRCRSLPLGWDPHLDWSAGPPC